MIHPGELAVQQRAGVVGDARGSARLNAVIPPVATDFLANQRLLVLGAADDRGAMWAGLVTGPAGFVTAPDERTVRINTLPAEADPLRPLLGNGTAIGAIAVEPQTRRRMRVNGHVEIVDGCLVIRTDQVFSNCPKYIQSRHPLDAAATPPPHRVATGRELSGSAQRWIGSADTFFVATGTHEHGLDVSHRGGNPGFVTVAGPRRLTWPDYAGNTMYLTLGNLHLNPSCGLLFLDWTTGAALHLAGRARTDWDPVRTAAMPGAQRLVEFDIDAVLEVRDASTVRWAFDAYHRFNPPVA
jgi:uncharacterized protein